MNELAEFLLARIAEDEKAAERAVVWNTNGGLVFTGPTRSTANVLAVSGHRLLAECRARRRIVDQALRYADWECADSGDPWSYTGEALELTLRLLAEPYCGHPDWDPDWRPSVP